ncbi:hypothetical protein D9758_009899 [Tetrapyrgos nigripes]|uniref:Uncharacterized protein n=1 Tax=Tetrapyrgos nigripes TaxID=182062 RepID=A0A8H5GMG4_9AGAR|nr:hypothetical protein D9758_009899 [Tetrapyrgos nigripes]
MQTGLFGDMGTKQEQIDSPPLTAILEPLQRKKTTTSSETPLVPSWLLIVLEYIPGKVTDTLDRLIALYRLSHSRHPKRKTWQIGKGMTGSVEILFEAFPYERSD